MIIGIFLIQKMGDVMKKLFSIISLAVMLFTVTEVTAKERKEYYTIIAPDSASMELAKYTVAKLDLDTTVYSAMTYGDSVISVLLTFNIDRFMVKDSNNKNIVVIVASVEIQIFPEKTVYVPIGDIVVGLLNTQTGKDGFVSSTKYNINRLINRYIKETVTKVRK